MPNIQLNTRVDEEAYKTLSDLTLKLRTTKGHLIEKAIYLLNDHFMKLEKSIESQTGPVAPTATPESVPVGVPTRPVVASDIFLALLGKSTEQYDELYKKLAGDLPKPR